MSKKLQPIAVFDSGVGGISVLRELIKILPNEDYIYYGDSINAPYGMKDKETVKQLTINAAEYLFAQGAKGLVVACNTATSAAVRALREMYPDIPIVGIEPAVKPAATLKPNCRVLAMATPMTIREEKFQNLMAKYADQAAEIIPLPCPGLMDFVERGDLNSDSLRSYLEELLFAHRIHPVDSVVLGCTHYPFVKDMIQEILGPDVLVYDGGEGTAREMSRRLAEADLLNPRNERGTVDFRNSLEDESKIALCKLLLER